MLHYTEEYLCDLCEASTSHLDLEKLASKKVLVTGASGLICSALVDQLLIWNKMHKLDMVIYAAGRSKEKNDAPFFVLGRTRLLPLLPV